jgi:hypothetical protein
VILLEKPIVTVNTLVLKDDLKYNDVVLLTYKIEYPEFKSFMYQMALAMINKYYKTKALEYQNYLINELFPMAVEQYKNSIENNYPIRTYEALVIYKLTYNSNCIISLYSDKYEFTGGAHGSTIRTSQTWNLQKYAQIELSELFGCSLNYKEYIFNQVIRQIQENPDIYFENYKELVVKNFNENNFYCTPNGIVIYYQQYDIAPYSSGIREFLIPYTDCVYNPEKTCFII